MLTLGRVGVCPGASIFNGILDGGISMFELFYYSEFLPCFPAFYLSGPFHFSSSLPALPVAFPPFKNS